VGSVIRQPHNIPLYGGKADNPTPKHGPFRVAASYQTVVSKNYIFSNTGWSGGRRGTIARQPAIRLGTNGLVSASETFQTGYIGENHIKCGQICIALSTKNNRTMHHRGQFVIANNFLEATSYTRVFIATTLGASVTRNNIAYQANLPNDSHNKKINFFGTNDDGLHTS
jgi:hypothetical protein